MVLALPQIIEVRILKCGGGELSGFQSSNGLNRFSSITQLFLGRMASKLGDKLYRDDISSSQVGKGSWALATYWIYHRRAYDWI